MAGLKPAWKPLSFLDNFNAAADALGYDQLGVAWGLASVDFPTIEERERFLNALVSVPFADAPIAEAPRA